MTMTPINVDININREPEGRASPLSDKRSDMRPYVQGALASAIILWGATVVIAAESGWLAGLYPPVIGAIVAATIALPTLCYHLSPGLRDVIQAIGHRRIVQFHIWRIPAALMFFWYGAQGALPPLFWILAGVGDLLAGSYALRIASVPADDNRYFRFHCFGFADFVVAVGTGLTFTLLLDPRMGAITQLPLALIPLFGVGISGASHLMAFDMLRRSAQEKSAQ
jgi:hypothetical protein